MGECFIVRKGGADLNLGSDLNLKIVNGTSAPSSPAENTIWVNTDAEIPSWVISPVQPENSTEGQVWIEILDPGVAAINVLEKNGMWLPLNRVLQYDGSTWVGKDAKVYKGGAWQDLNFRNYIYKSGDASSSLISTTNHTAKLEYRNTYLSVYGATYIGFVTANKVTVKAGQTLCLDIVVATKPSYEGFSLSLASEITWAYVVGTHADGAYAAEHMKSLISADDVGTRMTFRLPITINGDYYIGGGTYYNTAPAVDAGLNIYNLWIE